MSIEALRMRIDLPATGPPPTWPEGLAARTFRDADAARLHALLRHGYRHGGGSVAAFPAWHDRVTGDSEYDPELVVLVEAGDVLAAASICWTSAFVKDLVVHEDWRRRGLGESLFGARSGRSTSAARTTSTSRSRHRMRARSACTNESGCASSSGCPDRSRSRTQGREAASPGCVEVGPRREAPVELEDRHAVCERPGPARGRRPGRRPRSTGPRPRSSTPGGEQVAVELARRHQAVEVRMGKGELAVRARQGRRAGRPRRRLPPRRRRPAARSRAR